MKEKKTGIIVLAVALLLCITAISYAIFSFSKAGSKQSQVTTGTLIMELDESATNGISLPQAIPLSDAEGIALTPYKFKVKNTGTLNARYKIQLVDDEAVYTADGCTAKKLSHSKIKIAYTKNDDNGTPTVQFLTMNNGEFELDTLTPGNTNTFTLRVWIDYNAGNEIMGQHFHGKLELKAIQEGQTNFDTGE